MKDAGSSGQCWPLYSVRCSPAAAALVIGRQRGAGPPEGQLDSEQQRAADTGLPPEDWLADLDAPVTFQEYAELTGVVVERWDDSRMGQWRALMAQAALSQKEIDREDGFWILSYVWVLMGRNREEVVSYLEETINPDLVYAEEMRDAQQGLNWHIPTGKNRWQMPATSTRPR